MHELFFLNIIIRIMAVVEHDVVRAVVLRDRDFGWVNRLEKGPVEATFFNTKNNSNNNIIAFLCATSYTLFIL